MKKYVGANFILQQEKEGLRIIVNDSSKPDMNELFLWDDIKHLLDSREYITEQSKPDLMEMLDKAIDNCYQLNRAILKDLLKHLITNQQELTNRLDNLNK